MDSSSSLFVGPVLNVIRFWTRRIESGRLPCSDASAGRDAVLDSGVPSHRALEIVDAVRSDFEAIWDRLQYEFQLRTLTISPALRQQARLARDPWEQVDLDKLRLLKLLSWCRRQLVVLGVHTQKNLEHGWIGKFPQTPVDTVAEFSQWLQDSQDEVQRDCDLSSLREVVFNAKLWLLSRGLIDRPAEWPRTPNTFGECLRESNHLLELSSTLEKTQEPMLGVTFLVNGRMIYVKDVEVAIARSGYKPVRIDGDPKSIVLIKARFQFAKFVTTDSDGVHVCVSFEAGYVKWLRNPVAWIRWVGNVDQVPSDLSWTEDATLSEHLTERILATIGPGPLAQE